jgi:type I restriction-modification system DNA methylase subunit
MGSGRADRRHLSQGAEQDPGPAKLRRLIADLIDKVEWSSLYMDLKGDAYEGLLHKNAEDVKGGAGQYFTLRGLIQALVEVMQARPRGGDLRSGVRHRRLPAGGA